MDNTGSLLTDDQGRPEIRICGFEFLKRLGVGIQKTHVSPCSNPNSNQPGSPTARHVLARSTVVSAARKDRDKRKGQI